MSEDENDFRSLPRRLFDAALEDECDSVEVPKILSENDKDHVFESFDERSDSAKEQRSVRCNECTEETLQGYDAPALEDMLGVLRTCVAGEALALREAEEARSAAERELEQLRLEIRALEVSRNRLLEEIEQMLVRRQELQATSSHTLKPSSEHVMAAWVSKDPSTAATLMLARSLVPRALDASEMDGMASTDVVTVAADGAEQPAAIAEPEASPPLYAPLSVISPPSSTTATSSSPVHKLVPSLMAGHAFADAPSSDICADGDDGLYRAEADTLDAGDAATTMHDISDGEVDDFVTEGGETGAAAMVVKEDVNMCSEDEVDTSRSSPQTGAVGGATPGDTTPQPPLHAHALAAAVVTTLSPRPNEHVSSSCTHSSSSSSLSSPADASSPAATDTSAALTTPRRPRLDAAVHAPSPAVAALEHDLLQLQRRWNVERHQLLHLGAAETQRLSRRPGLTGAAWAGEELEEEVEVEAGVSVGATWLASRLDDNAVVEVIEAADGGADVDGGEHVHVHERTTQVSDVTRSLSDRSPRTRPPTAVYTSPPLPASTFASSASSPLLREVELDALHARVLQGDAGAVAALVALTTRAPQSTTTHTYTYTLTATPPSKADVCSDSSTSTPLTYSTISTSAPASVASVAVYPVPAPVSDAVAPASPSSTYSSAYASAAAPISVSIASSLSAPTATTPTPSQLQLHPPARSGTTATLISVHTPASTAVLHRSLSRLRTRLAVRKAAASLSTTTSAPTSPISASTVTAASAATATPIRVPVAPVFAAVPIHRPHLAASFSPASSAAFTPSRTLPRDPPSPATSHIAAASRSAPATARPLPPTPPVTLHTARAHTTVPVTPGPRVYPQTARLLDSARVARAAPSRPFASASRPPSPTPSSTQHSLRRTTHSHTARAVPRTASTPARPYTAGADPALPISAPVSMPGSALASPAPSSFSSLSAASTNTPRCPVPTPHPSPQPLQHTQLRPLQYSSPFAQPYPPTYPRADVSPYSSAVVSPGSPAPTALAVAAWTHDAVWRAGVAGVVHHDSPLPQSHPRSASTSASVPVAVAPHTSPAHTRLHTTPPYHTHVRISPPETPASAPAPSTDASPLPPAGTASYRARKDALVRETARAFGGASLAVVAERGRDAEWSKGRL